MKTTLALLALFSVAVPAGAAVVELLGYSTPAALSLETGLSLFVTAFALLIFTSAYGDDRRTDRPSRNNVTLLPAVEAFARSRAVVRSPRPAKRPRQVAEVSAR